jgi:hypothetical protein
LVYALLKQWPQEYLCLTNSCWWRRVGGDVEESWRRYRGELEERVELQSVNRHLFRA